MRKLLLVVSLIAVLAVSAVPSFAQDSTIVDIAVNDGRFDTLVAAVTAADLVGVLSSEGPFTVFAPTDAAFAKLPAGTIEALLGDIPTLTSILTYHVVAGEVPASAVVNAAAAATVQGGKVYIDVIDGEVILNGNVQVIITDIRASNGIIHVIDAVLLPPMSGMEDLRLVVSDTPVLSEPSGDDTGNMLEVCQTTFITEQVGTWGLVRDMGGWINLNATIDVAEDYGQPGGQEVVGGC